MAPSLLHIALFTSTIYRFGKPTVASFKDIAYLLTTPAGAKKKGRAFVPAYLKTHAHERVRRRKQDLYGVTMLSLDFDGVEATPEELLEPWAGYQSASWTTASHGRNEKTYFRIVVPYACIVDAKIHAYLVRWASSLYNPSCQPDIASQNPVQCFNTAREGAQVFANIDGIPLDFEQLPPGGIVTNIWDLHALELARTQDRRSRRRFQTIDPQSARLRWQRMSPSQQRAGKRRAKAALDRSRECIASASKGERARILFREAFKAGQWVGSGALEHAHAFVQLEQGASHLLMDHREKLGHLKNGLKRGQQHPIAFSKDGHIRAHEFAVNPYQDAEPFGLKQARLSIINLVGNAFELAKTRGELSKHDKEEAPVIVIAADCGTGKSTALLNHAILNPELTIRIAYATHKQRHEKLLELQAQLPHIPGTPPPVAQVVARSPHPEHPGFCTRHDVYDAHAHVSHKAAQNFCQSCDLHPRSGGECPYIKAKSIEQKARITLSTHEMEMRLQSQRDKEHIDIYAFDEDLSKSMLPTFEVRWSDIAAWRDAGDIILDDTNAGALSRAFSTKDRAVGCHELSTLCPPGALFDGLEDEEDEQLKLFGGHLAWKIIQEAQRTCIDDLSWSETLKSAPSVAAKDAMLEAAAEGWRGAFVRDGILQIIRAKSTISRKNAGAILALDATATPETSHAIWGKEDVHFHPIRLKWPPGVRTRLAINTHRTRMIQSEWGMRQWMAVHAMPQIRGVGRVLHGTHKAFCVDEDRGDGVDYTLHRAVVDAWRKAGDAVAYLGGPVARGSNIYEHYDSVVVDTFRVPKDVLIARAQLLAAMAGEDWTDPVVLEMWLAQAKWQLEHSEIVQFVHRIRCLLKSDCRITLLDPEPIPGIPVETLESEIEDVALWRAAGLLPVRGGDELARALVHEGVSAHGAWVTRNEPSAYAELGVAAYRQRNGLDTTSSRSLNDTYLTSRTSSDHARLKRFHHMNPWAVDSASWAAVRRIYQPLDQSNTPGWRFDDVHAWLCGRFKEHRWVNVASDCVLTGHEVRTDSGGQGGYRMVLSPRDLSETELSQALQNSLAARSWYESGGARVELLSPYDDLAQPLAALAASSNAPEVDELTSRRKLAKLLAPHAPWGVSALRARLKECEWDEILEAYRAACLAVSEIRLSRAYSVRHARPWWGRFTYEVSELACIWWHIDHGLRTREGPPSQSVRYRDQEA